MTNTKKIVIFIDGANFNAAFKQCHFRPNYGAIEQFFAQQGEIVGKFYFTGILPDDGSTFKGVMDHIEYHGWTVVSKPTKVINGQVKGNMDVEIVVRAWRMWEHFTDLILFSGDGDFSDMVSMLQEKGRRVTAVSVHNRGDSQSMMSDELRRKVNTFIDLRSLKDIIKMDDSPRPRPVNERPFNEPEQAKAMTLSFLRGGSNG